MTMVLKILLEEHDTLGTVRGYAVIYIFHLVLRGRLTDKGGSVIKSVWLH